MKAQHIIQDFMRIDHQPTRQYEPLLTSYIPRCHKSFITFLTSGRSEGCISIAATNLLSIATIEGRDSTPSAAIIDSQSVKTTETRGERGFDAGYEVTERSGVKKVTGRKRHAPAIVVDTLGLLLVVMVHSAGIQDLDGAKLLMNRLATEYFPRLFVIWADSG